MSNGRKVARAAGFIMITMLIARVLGYVRDMIIYSWFGQSYATDAFNAAFSIPDLIYMLLVGGALSSAFIPIFSGYLARGEEDEAWEVASIMFNLVLLVMLAAIAVAMVYTRPLIVLLVPKLPAVYIDQAVTLTRIMFIQTVFMGLNGVALGILNSRQHFITPALGGIAYNLGIILVGVLLAKHWGIAAFSVGVVAGSVLNLLVQVPALKKAGIRYHFSLNIRHPGVVQILILMVPVLIGLSVTQVNLLVNQNLASGLPEGSISALKLAQRIMQLPVGIFGVSIAMAVFPTMTQLAALNEKASLKRTFNLGLRAMFLVTIPAGFGLMALRMPVVKLFFEQGQFDAQDAITTAQALYYYSLALFSYSGLQLLNRMFYSLQDTITPVVTAVIAIGANRILSVVLVESMGHSGLALAYAISGVLNMLLLIGVLRFRIGKIDGSTLLKSFTISFAASMVMYFTVNRLSDFLIRVLPFADKVDQMIAVLVGVVVGGAIYALIVLQFKLEETRLILDMIKKRFPGLRLGS